ncbi:NUDIX domain-containing protein [Lysobacter auxotrophicus]|uniref:NUDIX domain-containing protein n=1 Tax=Lysobacter auxotrophicus TaxID=2992573 RepID=A0ABM8DA49_9GAMM|nr:NUDIX domain-containing protein [Lysobacter auxotrophicus]BDU15420.1 NUDIX domain-containing protein [Lysobacter auxotrophicus]
MHDCVGALLVRDGAILLGKRRDDCDWLAGAWDVFGGHVEEGESGEQAIARELAEELGIVVEVDDLCRLGQLEGEAPEPWRLRLYRVASWNGEPANLAEHSELRWCALDDAQDKLRGAHVDFPRLLALAVEAAAATGRP